MGKEVKIFTSIRSNAVEKYANDYAQDHDLEIHNASLTIHTNPISGAMYCLTVVYEDKPKEIAEYSDTIHAKWEISSDGYYPYCSNCKEEPQGREMTKWCPNCGARMDKE